MGKRRSRTTPSGAPKHSVRLVAVYPLHDPSGRQLEDFTGKPHPNTGLGTVTPTSHDASKQAAAQTYAEGAVRHFRAHHPVLSKILWAQSGTAQQVIVEDMERVFAAGPNTYYAKDAVRLAGERIRQGFEKQAPQVMLISRMALVIAFIIIETITRTLLIRAALGDIKEEKL